MKEFRVAKCLVNGEIKDYAIFADGTRKSMIETDKDNLQFFLVRNDLNTGVKGRLRFSFSGRIKDAIDTIKAGNGDCITVTHLFGEHINVLYYIDRAVGEDLRKKTLEGWKSARFGYSIKCGYSGSLSGYSFLNDKFEMISILAKDESPIIFDSEEDAKNCVNDIIETSKQYAREVVNDLSGAYDEEEVDNIIYKSIDKIKTSGDKHDIVMECVGDMLTNDYKLKSPECDLDNFGFRVVQHCY